MAIAFRAATAVAYGAATTRTLSRPTDTADNDILIAGLNHETAITSVPSGWALVGSSIAGTGHNLSVYWKRAASEPASWDWGQSGGGYIGGVVAAYSGAVTSGTPYEAQSDNDDSGTDVVTWTGITTISAGAMLVAVCARYLSGGLDASTASAPLTNNERGGNVNGIKLLDGVQASAGASGDKTATLSGDDSWTAKLLALSPPSSVTDYPCAPTDGSATVTATTPVRVQDHIRTPLVG